MGRFPEDSRRRRRRLHRETGLGFRGLKRYMRRLIRHPLFPKQPTSIVRASKDILSCILTVLQILALLVFTVIAILITLLLMHILNPDKASLPWRTYCSIPSTSIAPPSVSRSYTDENLYMQVPVGFDPASPSESIVSNPFPPPHLDDIPPAGLFLGVFTTDSAVERRMLIRNTWASQERSRFGAGEGDGGNGTSRTIVRFVLGKPRSSWVRRIQLESESAWLCAFFLSVSDNPRSAYNDMIHLPISENMNSGKTHAFFSWAADNAWVPPPAQSYQSKLFSYTNTNRTGSPPPPAPHDPPPNPLAPKSRWVPPDYVVKADDDSFVMLAELEARLRVELDNAMRDAVAEHAIQQHVPDFNKLMYPASIPHSVLTTDDDPHHASQVLSEVQSQASAWLSRGALYSSAYAANTDGASSIFAGVPSSRTDPLIYWGYLVKNRFMAGELYALSWSLVNWIATEPSIKSMTRGAEDKQTSKWMRLHPRAKEIRWATERCWIYDHPRAGTVYSHGFLFPSEATRVRRSILSLLRPSNGFRSSSLSTSSSASSSPPTSTSSYASGKESTDVTYELPSPLLATTPSYSYSSVSRFGTHYTFPLSNLTPLQSIEALVEGSAMSALFEGGPETASQAWEKREGRRKRYEGSRVGGTVVVHFIKKNEWYLETALAMLGGEEVLEGEEWSENDIHLGNDGKSREHLAQRALSRRRR